MSDEFPSSTSGEDDLVLQALLYTSGELDLDDAEAFEKRLGEDQAARDALCRAVELTQTLVPAALPGPDPAYRTVVRHRLRQRHRQRLGLSQNSGSFFSHPAFWSILGAGLAVLFMVIISQIVASLETLSPPAPGTAPTGQTVTREPVSGEMANIWADWNNNDRLEKVRAEELVRRLREGKRPPLRLGWIVEVEEREP